MIVCKQTSLNIIFGKVKLCFIYLISNVNAICLKNLFKMLKGTEGKRFQLFLMGTKNKTLYQTLEGNIQQQYGKRKITPIIFFFFAFIF